MRTYDRIAAEADLLQATTYCELLHAERDDLARQLSTHVRLLTAATTPRQGDAIECRRAIRRIEAEIRQVDRMVEALARRFPGAVRERA